jgi:YebC/PmpR family DNA-binding regulatory protein
MAGHSHYKNMAHHKGIMDAKRARLWSKLSRAIMVAVKVGGSDPVMNVRLRFAIDQARSLSMPKDNIERAVKKGAGELGGSSYDEISYEGYGPGGVAILCEILTDNRNRTNGEVRKIFERGGGNMGAPGCVAYMFERKGLFEIPAKDLNEETLMTMALDAGAEDVQLGGDSYEVTCDPTVYAQVKAAFEKANLTLTSAALALLGKIPVDCDTETGQKVLKLLEAIDDHDDVQNVYSNLNVTDAMMAE